MCLKTPQEDQFYSLKSKFDLIFTCYCVAQPVYPTICDNYDEVTMSQYCEYRVLCIVLPGVLRMRKKIHSNKIIMLYILALRKKLKRLMMATLIYIWTLQLRLPIMKLCLSNRMME